MIEIYSDRSICRGRCAGPAAAAYDVGRSELGLQMRRRRPAAARQSNKRRSRVANTGGGRGYTRPGRAGTPSGGRAGGRRWTADRIWCIGTARRRRARWISQTAAAAAVAAEAVAMATVSEKQNKLAGEDGAARTAGGICLVSSLLPPPPRSLAASRSA